LLRIAYLHSISASALASAETARSAIVHKRCISRIRAKPMLNMR
jgi:hypothetical protein